MTHISMVILGLSITSSWGNGHATTYRSLVAELAAQGHEILFIERDVPWYAENRDMPSPTFCTAEVYGSLGELRRRFSKAVREADLVILGSYVPDGVEVGRWILQTARGVTAFYDIDTPVTLAKLKNGDYEYLRPELISQFDMYLSFTGGPTLTRLEREYGSPMARPLYCSVNPHLYFPEHRRYDWDLGYLGTYSEDRQPALDELLNAPARMWQEGRFIVAGPQYPDSVTWAPNVLRTDHIEPARHRTFYNAQRFTLNITRRDMITAGWSPSVRLFEAAACGTPIISDWWPGLDHFFEPDQEILVAHSRADVFRFLTQLSADVANKIGEAARQKLLLHHCARTRADQLLEYYDEAHSHTAKRSVLVG
jgi:spore maturation protein CgeB